MGVSGFNQQTYEESTVNYACSGCSILQHAEKERFFHTGRKPDDNEEVRWRFH
jgi:hypothetical protein